METLEERGDITYTVTTAPVNLGSSEGKSSPAMGALFEGKGSPAMGALFEGKGSPALGNIGEEKEKGSPTLGSLREGKNSPALGTLGSPALTPLTLGNGKVSLAGEVAMSPGESTWEGPDGCGEVLTVRWNKEPQDVSAFAQRWDLPQVVRLSGSGFKDFDQPLLLYAARRSTNLSASCVRWDQSSREYTDASCKLVIPLNYPGWFLFLAERGKTETSYRTIESVAEAKPDSFLARTAITAYSYTKKRRTGEKIYHKVHIPPGEIFTVGSIVVESIDDSDSPPGGGYSAACCCWGRGSKNRELFYLQCADTLGEEVLLPFDATGQFYKIGEPGVPEQNQVFQLNDIARCVKYPVEMKLVYGEPPASDCNFTNILRFEEMYFQESLIACTLFEDKITMIEFPTDSEIQFIRASNVDDLLETSWVVRHAVTYCDENCDVYNTGIKVRQSVFKTERKDENSNHLCASQTKLTADNMGNVNTTNESDLLRGGSKNDAFLGECDSLKGTHAQCDSLTHAQKQTPRTMRKSASSSDIERQQQQQRYTSLPRAGECRRSSLRLQHSTSIQERDLPEPPGTNPHGRRQQTTPDTDAGSATVFRPHTPQTVTSDDPDYETIPYFKKATPQNQSDSADTPKRMLAVDFKIRSPDPPPLLPERDFPRQGAVAVATGSGGAHDEEGYLTPIEYRKQLTSYRSSIGFDLGQNSPSTGAPPLMRADPEVNYANTLLLRVPPAPGSVRQPRSRLPRTPLGDLYTPAPHPPLARAQSMITAVTPGQLSGTPGGLAHHTSLCDHQGAAPGVNLSMYDEAHLHSFLTDTIQELNRRKSRTEGSEGGGGNLTPATSRSDLTSRSSVKHRQPDPPETVAELAEFLENIFDVDNDEDEDAEAEEEEGERQHARSSSSDGYRLPEEPRSLFIRQESGRTDSGVMVNQTSSVSEPKPPGEGEYIYRTFSDCSWSPPDTLESMSVEEVALCLRYIGMREKIVLRFCEEQMDGKQLMELDQEMLDCFTELNAFEKKKIIDFKKGWRPKRFASDC